MNPRSQRDAPRLIGVLLAYVTFACVLTWPLVAHFDRAVIGDLKSDVWKHVWGFWWMQQCFAVDHALPLFTWLLNYPYGGSLFFIDPLGAALSLPLQLFMGPVAAYNTMVLFNIVLACYGAFLLASYVTKNLPGAFVAGVIYGCSPYLLSNITSGISESFNVGWIPLFILCYTRALREPAKGYAWKAGILLGLATIGCWYYGVFCVVYAVFFFVYELVRRAARRGAATEGRARASRLSFARARPWLALGLALIAIECLRNARDAYVQAETCWPSAVISVACVSLLVALLHRGRSDESPPPSKRRLGLRFLAQAGVALSLYGLLEVVRTSAPESGTDWRPMLSLVPFGGLWGALGVWSRAAAAPLSSRLALARDRVGTVAVGLFALLLVSGIFRQLIHPPEDTDDRLIHGAWLGIGWLVALGGVARARATFEAALAEIISHRRAHRTNGDARRLFGMAVLAAACVYLFVPPSSTFGTLSAWGAMLLALVALREAVGGVSSAAAVGRTAAQRVLERGDAHAVRIRLQCVALVRRAIVVALVSATIIVPVAWCFRTTLNSDVSLVFRMRNRRNVDFYLSEKFHNISRLVDYVTPGKARAVRTYTVDRLTRVSYAGWLVMMLAGTAIVAVRRRDLWWWCAVAVGAATLSLGPFLYVTSDIHLSGRFPPYMWMYDWFPFFSQVSIPFRFNTVAMLALAVLSAYALAQGLRGRRRSEGALLALAVSLAVLIEVMYVSPAPFPVPLASTEAPPILARLAQESGPCGLLDIPVQRLEGELLPGEYFFYQLIHGKYLPNRVEGEIPLYVYRNRFMLQLFHLEHDWTGYPNESEASLRKSLDELRGFRFRYFVVHENLLRPGAGERLHAMLAHFLGPPRHRDGGITVYDTDGGADQQGAGIP